MSKTSVVKEGWFGIIHEKVNNFFDSWDLSYDSIKKMAVYGGIGFFCGFLAKRFGTTLFIAGLLAICLIYGLESTDFITFNADKLKVYLGFAHNTTLADVIDIYWNWIRQNVPLSVSIGIGFIAGYRIG